MAQRIVSSLLSVLLTLLALQGGSSSAADLLFAERYYDTFLKASRVEGWLGVFADRV